MAAGIEEGWTEALAYLRPSVKPNSERAAGGSSHYRRLPQPIPQPDQDDLRDQPAHIPAVPGDLLNQAGPQVRIQRIGRHEQRLYPGQAVVHLRHHLLVLEVADRAEPLDDGRDVVGPAEVDDQPVKSGYPHVLVAGGDLAEHLHPLVGGEQRLLGDVVEHGDHDLVVQPGGPADDVKVPVRDGVEGARTDDAAHAIPPFGQVDGHVMPAAHPWRDRTRGWPRRTAATCPRRNRRATAAALIWCFAPPRPRLPALASRL